MLKKFEESESGELTVNNVIALVVGLIVLAIMLPVAIDEISGVNTTGWSTSVAAVWDLLPIIAVLAGLVMITSAYMKKK